MTKGTITFGQAYDRDSNVTSESRSLPSVAGDPGTGSQSFTYDALNRVTASSGLASGSRSYVYDLDGNRVRKVEGGVTSDMTFDRTDQQIQVTTTGGTPYTAFNYDAYGNLTSNAESVSSVTAMTYDAADKLTGIDAAGTANDASFTFDALGRFRTRVLGGGTSTDTYSYAGSSETVLRISNSSGPTVTDSLVSPAGDRLGIKQGSTLNWLLPDLHGNVGASLDASEATVVNATRYDAYGQTILTGSAGGTAVGQANWKFQGRLDVSPSGLATPLYDMSARFYSPGLGTFTQFDSVMGGAQNPLSMNRFLYALANPVTLIDPTGHCPGNRPSIDGTCVGASHKGKHPESPGATPPPQKSPPKAPDETSGPSPTHSVPSWLWAEYSDYLRSKEYLYRDRLIPPKLYENDGDAALAFLGWYGFMIGGAGAPGATASGLIAASTCGDHWGCQIVAGFAGGTAWELTAPRVGPALARVSTSVVGRLSTSGAADAQAWLRLLASRQAGGLAGKGSAARTALEECVGSFAPETTVATPGTAIAISLLSIGDTVLARDPDTGEVAEHEVTDVSVRFDPAIEHLVVDSETVETTPDHKFLTEDGWVEAGALWAGTRVQKLDGTFGTVRDFSIEVRPVVMWDLMVSHVHTFAVGEGKWVVHNDCLGDLSSAEISQIQHFVDEAGRPLDVVGSAAKGERRNPGADLPFGKGASTKSDIDYLAPGSHHPYFGDSTRLPEIDPNHGIIPGVHNPSLGPSIRFEPGYPPFYIPGT